MAKNPEQSVSVRWLYSDVETIDDAIKRHEEMIATLRSLQEEGYEFDQVIHDGDELLLFKPSVM